MRILLGFALLPGLLSCAPLAALGENSASKPTVEELYAGELDDVGPQYLVLPVQRAPKRFTLWSRLEFAESDNATYAEVTPGSSDMSSVQLGIDAACLKYQKGRSLFRVDVGLRGQLFRFGLLGGGSKVIDYLQVDRNNFDLFGGYLRASWQRGPWMAEASLQSSVLRNQNSGRNFYKEVAQNISLYRRWNLPASSTLYVGGNVGRHWSQTDSYGLLPSSWNDRYEASLLALVATPLGKAWAWRNSLRVHCASYAHSDRKREDITGTLSTELAWQLCEGFEVRLYASHEERNSSEAAMPDYRRWELGSGCGLRWNF